MLSQGLLMECFKINSTSAAFTKLKPLALIRMVAKAI